MGDSMYLVDDDRGGKLEVKRHGSTVHVLQSGDTFGESSLLFRHPRKSTIICASTNAIFMSFLHPHFMICLNLTRVVKQHCTRRQVKELGNRCDLVGLSSLNSSGVAIQCFGVFCTSWD